MKIPEKNELVRICVWYRYISLAISTFMYFLMCGGIITPLRVVVATGMILASVIGARLYGKSLTNGAGGGAVVTMCMEVVAYGIFIIPSGGFLSPYLWYFVSAFTTTMAMGRYDRRFRIFAPLSVIWGVICAVSGGFIGIPPYYAAYAGVSTGIAVFVVMGGFYTLFIYVDKLDKNRCDLGRLNEELQLETIRHEQALKHTMEIYESFNLFSITNPDRVMDEIAALLYRTIAPNGCLLLKLSPLQEIENISSRGFAERYVAELAGRIGEFRPMSAQMPPPDRITLQGSSFSAAYIRSPYGTHGILVTPADEPDAEKERDAAREVFYLNLAGIILQELDLQAMVESCIINEEQTRIANEIHDTVIQKLFAVACSLRLLDKQQRDMSPDVKMERLKHVTSAVESTMRELREAIYGLRWDAPEQNLFAGKLALYMDEVRSLSGAEISLRIDDNAQYMTARQKTVFYRIICEAVNNAIRHGGATELDISVSLDGDRLSAEIIDNGGGFDRSMVRPDGQGIKNMYRMANLLKGQLSIDSQIGKGTAIRCSLPTY